MNKKIIYILIIFIALILQTSVVPNLFPPLARPNIILMLIIACTIVDGFVGFFPWIIGIGLAYDALTFSVVGVHVLVMMISAYFVSFFSRRLSVDLYGTGILIVMLFVVFAMILQSFAMVLVYSADAKVLVTFSGIMENTTWLQLLKAFAWNIVVVLFLIWVLRKAKRYFSL